MGKLRLLLIIIICLVAATAIVAAYYFRTDGGKRPLISHVSWLDNGAVRLGANLDLGGSITCLAEQGADNLINSTDWGRQVQMSFYSGPVPYQPEDKNLDEMWKGLGWNPIQSGDAFGNRSKVLEYRNTGDEIYVKCIPMHWPLDNVPGECTFEVWYRLEGKAVKVRSRLTNLRDGDHTQYTARSQELPAVYTNGPWYKLVSYIGCEPFAGGASTVLVDRNDGKGWPWLNYMATENWSALLNEDNEGLGIINPGTYTYSGGFYGEKGAGGPKDAPTGYMGPTQKEILDWDIVYDYEYTLYVGSLDEIRQYACETLKKPAPPTDVFCGDRRHWTYQAVTDRGWPVEDGLNFTFGARNAAMVGPKCLWNAAEAPKLYALASFRTNATALTVTFEQYNGKEMVKGQTAVTGSVAMPIIGDGALRLYEVDLSQSPLYNGAISSIQIKFPEIAGEATVKAIGFDKALAEAAGANP